MGSRIRIVDSVILGLISFTPPTFIPPFDPPEHLRLGCRVHVGCSALALGFGWLVGSFIIWVI